MNIEEKIEELYWQFDGDKKGYGERKGCPMMERDAFKKAVHTALAEHRKHVADLILVS